MATHSLTSTPARRPDLAARLKHAARRLTRRVSFRSSTLQRVLDDPERKPLPVIAGEAARFGLATREVPRQYFHTMLYRRRVANPLGYLSHGQYWRLRALVERRELVPLFLDKLKFQRHFEAAPGVRLPRYLGHTEVGPAGGRVFHAPDGTTRPLGSAEDLAAVLQGLHEADGAVFAKPLTDYGGRGAHKLAPGADVQALFADVQRADYLFQAVVAQHPAVAAVYPHSINSCRVITCIPADGQVRVCSARIRFGQAGSVVDNGTSGGFCGSVDLNTGRVAARCTSRFARGARVAERHPDTGVAFGSLEIPFFGDGLAMMRAAAEHLPYPLVGWDVAFAPDGPVLVEGNDNPDYHADEIPNGGYLAHPTLGPFIRELTGGQAL